MRRGGLWMLVGLLVVALGCGVASLYRLRVARGDVFPAYSSLRADPLGLRALYDAAGRLPGRGHERWLRPLERLQAGAGDTVFVIGVENGWRGDFDEESWNALDRAAVGGARVVIGWKAQKADQYDAQRMRTMRADPWPEPVVEKKDAKPKQPVGEKNDKPETDTESDKKSKDEAPTDPMEHERRWGYRLGRRELMNHPGEADAFRAREADAAWPATLAHWRSDLFFLTRPADGWRVLYRRGTEPVMIERKRGAGSVVMVADSFILSNEAVQRERATPVLAALIGDARRVVFVESHLGVEIESGVAVLARHYGLGGAALTALVLTGLWIWRRAAPLAPIIPEDDEVRLSLAPTAGLEALLRRAVSPASLYSACLDAWKPQAGVGHQRRLETAPPLATGTHPVTAYNATTRTLSHKRIS
jgi:hypothetical protein